MRSAERKFGIPNAAYGDAGVNACFLRKKTSCTYVDYYKICLTQSQLVCGYGMRVRKQLDCCGKILCGGGFYDYSYPCR